MWKKCWWSGRKNILGDVQDNGRKVEAECRRVIEATCQSYAGDIRSVSETYMRELAHLVGGELSKTMRKATDCENIMQRVVDTMKELDAAQSKMEDIAEATLKVAERHGADAVNLTVTTSSEWVRRLNAFKAALEGRVDSMSATLERAMLSVSHVEDGAQESIIEAVKRLNGVSDSVLMSYRDTVDAFSTSLKGKLDEVLVSQKSDCSDAVQVMKDDARVWLKEVSDRMESMVTQLGITMKQEQSAHAVQVLAARTEAVREAQAETGAIITEAKDEMRKQLQLREEAINERLKLVYDTRLSAVRASNERSNALQLESMKAMFGELVSDQEHVHEEELGRLTTLVKAEIRAVGEEMKEHHERVEARIGSATDDDETGEVDSFRRAGGRGFAAKELMKHLVEPLQDKLVSQSQIIKEFFDHRNNGDQVRKAVEQSLGETLAGLMLQLQEIGASVRRLERSRVPAAQPRATSAIRSPGGNDASSHNATALSVVDTNASGVNTTGFAVDSPVFVHPRAVDRPAQGSRLVEQWLDTQHDPYDAAAPNQEQDQQAPQRIFGDNGTIGSPPMQRGSAISVTPGSSRRGETRSYTRRDSAGSVGSAASAHLGGGSRTERIKHLKGILEQLWRTKEVPAEEQESFLQEARVYLQQRNKNELLSLYEREVTRLEDV